MLRTFVTFGASFPDDSVFSTTGSPEIPGGKNVVTAVVELLRVAGAEVTDPVQHSDYGWQFTLHADGKLFVFLLQYPGSWLLFSRPVKSLLDRLRSERDDQAHRKALEQVSTVLSHDTRFTRRSWFTKEEYERDSSRSRHEKP